MPRKFGWWYAATGQFLPDKPGTPEENLAQQFIPSGTYTGSLSHTLGAAELNMRASGYPDFDNCPPGPYSFGPGSGGNPCDAFHNWSFHPGGAYFMFADGSVRFLGYGASGTLLKLATAAANDVAP